jgi:Fe/S biogenesis protein NfuA
MARSVEELALVSLTPEARQVVMDAVSQEPDPDRLALWLEVRGVQQGAFVYDLYFQALADAGEGDVVVRDNDLAVVVPAASAEQLRGARLEWSAEGEGGLVLVNPNTPAPEQLGVPAEALAQGTGGPIGSRVAVVLEQIVNPSIAGHGGRADLVAMDEAEGVAYLRLSGGCQGCAMSRMTLTQGIEVALRDEIPEVLRVVDVTDHSGGENPYY